MNCLVHDAEDCRCRPYVVSRCKASCGRAGRQSPRQPFRIPMGGVHRSRCFGNVLLKYTLHASHELTLCFQRAPQNLHKHRRRIPPCHQDAMHGHDILRVTNGRIAKLMGACEVHLRCLATVCTLLPADKGSKRAACHVQRLDRTSCKRRDKHATRASCGIG